MFFDWDSRKYLTGIADDSAYFLCPPHQQPELLLPTKSGGLLYCTLSCFSSCLFQSSSLRVEEKGKHNAFATWYIRPGFSKYGPKEFGLKMSGPPKPDHCRILVDLSGLFYIIMLSFDEFFEIGQVITKNVHFQQN